MLSLSAYPALFLSALGAATLLPLQSEALLVALLLAGKHPLWALLLVATLGNVLGSWINWLLGRSLERYRERRWFPVSPARLEQAQAWYARYGRWSLLLSWMPVIGDPLTLVAGVMRERLWVFLLIVTLAKAGRYAVLAALTLSWT
ncbi:DedA family protein [Pseudomonas oleovorans]|jgi:membrane protein YqaA with SNARE-associated domain|uniref:DedA family protein n=1 Tax=Ectopseudomonas oleovorans TaxID=301 RepID=A0AB35KY91_ECTOL|nr:YqaA family protein [Pseudomonas oleovorans]MCR1826521.1 DedA family protein [Pseudomonas oleovorans]MDH0566126.1 DedA family protein [Pseudomonas oleovorans]